MNLLVAAAATAAGYIAEFWQNLFPKEQEASLQATAEASIRGFQGTKNEYTNEFGELFSGFSVHEVGVFGGSSSSRSRQLRSKSCGHFVKPVNSSESCVAAQLYRERARMEEYVYNSIQSITTLAIRPFFMTDVSQVIRDSSSFKEDMKIESTMKQSIGKAQQSRKLSSGRTRVSSGGGALHSQGCDLFFGFDELAFMHFVLDPNFVVDVVQEDLPPLKVPRLTAVLSESDSDVNGIQTDYTHRANCGVLSIRLHEVIHSRLEARIMELETALEDTQMRLHAMDSEHMISLNNLYVEKKSSSTQESPTFMDEGYDMNGHFIINLSGEALDTYSEAYKEISMITLTDEEAPPETTHNSDCTEKELNPFDKNLFKGQIGDCTGNGSSSQYDIIEERLSSSLNPNDIRTKEEKVSRSSESDYTGKSEDVDEDDDEMGKLLIKRIVEKTRQGSSVVLNAQRMLYSMDKQ
ncbi:hypothetical protein FCV25MIE_11731 [Fagus crenata]